MILLLLSFLRTAAISQLASFFCEPPRLVGPLPYYRYILSTGLADGCERLHDSGVIWTTGGGDRGVVPDTPRSPPTPRRGRIGAVVADRLGSAGQPGII